MVWKRPSEIRDRNPKFIVGSGRGYDQFDAKQGTSYITLQGTLLK